MLNRSRLSSLVLATLLSATTASAQQTPRPAPPTANQILLDVVVTEKSGPPVGDLTQQDFTLLDNKAPQTITSFKVVTGREAPVEVLLVIDTVNANYRTVALARTD